MDSFEDQKKKLEEMRNYISHPDSLNKYIEAYEYIFEHTIDLSPLGLVRQTERKMLNELKHID